jgi:hypothetical protein
MPKEKRKREKLRVCLVRGFGGEGRGREVNLINSK